MQNNKKPPAFDGETLRLAHAGFTAEIAPALGASLLSFSVHGQNILRSGDKSAVAADPREAALYLCVPWFGRLYAGLAFRGKRWMLAPTLPAGDAVHPLHGDGWISPWTVLVAKSTEATLNYVHAPAPGRFPFPYVAEQIVVLDGDGLSIALCIENSGAEPMPAGLGLHPFFRRSNETRLRFRARELWTPGEQGGARGPIPPALDFSKGAALPDFHVDHSFIDFSGEAALDLGSMKVNFKSDAPILHVYAPEGGDFFCLEPVTHLPGAFGNDVLPPGGRLALRLKISPA